MADNLLGRLAKLQTSLSQPSAEDMMKEQQRNRSFFGGMPSRPPTMGNGASPIRPITPSRAPTSNPGLSFPPIPSQQYGGGGSQHPVHLEMERLKAETHAKEVEVGHLKEAFEKTKVEKQYVESKLEEVRKQLEEAVKKYETEKQGDKQTWDREKEFLTRDVEAQKKIVLKLEASVSVISKMHDESQAKMKEFSELLEKARASAAQARDMEQSALRELEVLRAENASMQDTLQRLKNHIGGSSSSGQLKRSLSLESLNAGQRTPSSNPSSLKRNNSLVSIQDMNGNTPGYIPPDDPETGSIGRRGSVYSDDGEILEEEEEEEEAEGDNSKKNGSKKDPKKNEKEKDGKPTVVVPRARRILTNLVIHIIFVIIIVLVIISAREFQYGYAITNALKLYYQDSQWQDINTHYDWFNWLSASFIPKTYSFLSTNYNTNLALPLYSPPNPSQANINDNSPQPPTPSSWETKDSGYVLHGLRILGGIRVRQVRMDAGGCTTPSNLKQFLNSESVDCTPAYSLLSESTASFGGANSNAFTYSKEDPGLPFFGSYGTYGSAGFSVLLPGNSSEAVQDQLAYMMNNNFLDRQSRAVFVEITLVSPNTLLFAVLRFVTEFPITGGSVTYPSVIIINPFKYAFSSDNALLALEALVVAYIVKMAYDAIINFRRLKGKYFKKFYNWLELINLLLYIVVIGLRSTTVLSVSKLTIDPDPTKYVSLSTTAALIEAESNVFGFNGILSFLKIFDFFSLFPRLSMLTATLRKASKDIIGFSLVFLIVILAFSQAFFISFGKYLTTYASMGSTISTLFQMLFGQFNLDELSKTNRLLGPVLFGTFMLLAGIILVNVFVAILVDSFAEVRDDLRKRLKERTLADDLKDIVARVLRFGKAKQVAPVEAAKQQLVVSSKIDKELYEQLKLKLGQEISRFDVNNDHVLDDDEKAMLMEALTEEERKIVKASDLVAKELEQRSLQKDESEAEKEKREEEHTEILTAVRTMSSQLPTIIRNIQMFEEKMGLLVAFMPVSGSASIASAASAAASRKNSLSSGN